MYAVTRTRICISCFSVLFVKKRKVEEEEKLSEVMASKQQYQSVDQ